MLAIKKGTYTSVITEYITLFIPMSYQTPCMCVTGKVNLSKLVVPDWMALNFIFNNRHVTGDCSYRFLLICNVNCRNRTLLR